MADVTVRKVVTFEEQNWNATVNKKDEDHPYELWYYGSLEHAILLNDLRSGGTHKLYAGAMSYLYDKVKKKMRNHTYMHALMKQLYPDKVRLID